VREVNPLGVITHGQRHKPRAYQRQRHTPRTCQRMVNTRDVEMPVLWDKHMSHSLTQREEVIFFGLVMSVFNPNRLWNSLLLRLGNVSFPLVIFCHFLFFEFVEIYILTVRCIDWVYPTCWSNVSWHNFHFQFTTTQIFSTMLSSVNQSICLQHKIFFRKMKFFSQQNRKKCRLPQG